MICNICGEDVNCYVLTEGESRGPMVRPTGRLFMLCTECLTKLISNIKTEKTKFPTLRFRSVAINPASRIINEGESDGKPSSKSS